MAGCGKIFREKITGITANPPQLAKLVKLLAPSDMVITPAVHRQLERRRILDARRVADAKANGVKFGRNSIFAPHQQQEAGKRLGAGKPRAGRAQLECESGSKYHTR